MTGVDDSAERMRSLDPSLNCVRCGFLFEGAPGLCPSCQGLMADASAFKIVTLPDWLAKQINKSAGPLMAVPLGLDGELTELNDDDELAANPDE